MWQVVRYPVLFVLESLDWAINSIFSWMHDSIHLSSSSTLSDYSIISWLIRITSKMNSNSMWWRWRSMVSGSFTISVVSFSILFQWHLTCMNPTTHSGLLGYGCGYLFISVGGHAFRYFFSHKIISISIYFSLRKWIWILQKILILLLRIDTDPNKSNHHSSPLHSNPSKHSKPQRKRKKRKNQKNRFHWKLMDEIRCCSLSHLMPCYTNPLCCFSGFFRSDTLIGTATVKLQPLETACEIHDSFDVSVHL